MRKGTAKYSSLALCFILVSISTVHTKTYLPSPSVCWLSGGAGGAITCIIHVTDFFVFFFSILVPHTTNLGSGDNGTVWYVSGYSGFRPLRCCSIKKLRLHFLALLSKATMKLRLSQAQAKKLVKRLRLAFSPMRLAFSPMSPDS